jgi:hypothetical protein
MGKPIPVFPLVGSIITVLGLITSLASASWIILQQILSFALPPGFLDSCLASTVALHPATILFNLSKGVLPMVSMTLL